MTKSPETMLELLVPLLDPQIGVLTFSSALIFFTVQTSKIGISSLYGNELEE
jgi:hypothetical protein